MNRLKFRSANPHLIVVCFGILALPGVSDGKEYTTRQLTNFGDPAVGSQATPLAVVNDRLLFLAADNGKEGLYRTDGMTIDLVTDSLVFTTDSERFPTIETARLGNELFFAASGPDGRELYTTDGWSVRQVTNIAPGNLNAYPNNFRLVGDQLLFGAVDQATMSGQSVTNKLFRTDGASVEDLEVSFSFGGITARLGERLLFMGARLDGTSAGPFFSTDGHTIEPIDAPPVSPAVGRPWLF